MNNSFSKTENLQWCRMGPRATFGQFMIEIAKKNKKLMVISADLGRSSGLDRFKQLFPKGSNILPLLFSIGKNTSRIR